MSVHLRMSVAAADSASEKKLWPCLLMKRCLIGTPGATVGAGVTGGVCILLMRVVALALAATVLC